nr:unnamed protein product [Brassica oleracea]
MKPELLVIAGQPYGGVLLESTSSPHYEREGKCKKPLSRPAPKQCFTPTCPVNCCASTHFGENQLALGSSGISPLTTTHPLIFQHQSNFTTREIEQNAVELAYFLRVPIEESAGEKLEEGEDDVKSSCPLCSGRHTCYNG